MLAIARSRPSLAPPRIIVERPSLRGGIQASLNRRDHSLPEGVLGPLEILKPIHDLKLGVVRVFVAIIDQVKAKQLLMCNVGNRKISTEHVANLTQEVKLGWLLTNQGIGFTRDGILIDGQQRLTAVAQGAGAITTLVVCGLDPLVQQVIDHGRLRTIRDDIEIAGIRKKYKRELVSYVKLCAELFTSYSVKVTSAGAFDQWYLPFKEGVEWALVDMVKGKDTKLAPVGGALAFAYKTNPERVAAFGRDLRESDQISSRSPVGVLHDWLARNHNLYGGVARVDIYTKVLRHLRWYLDELKDVKGRKATSDTTEVVSYFRAAYQDHTRLKELERDWKGRSKRF